MSNEVKRRKGAISLEQAKNRFNEYYNLRWDDPVGQKRGKLFDMMYQKKPKYTLKPNEPGSERYLLEEGPRTFDMIGVDHFPEGEINNVPETDIKVKSKGSTYKKSYDIGDIESGKEGDDHPEVYGPRKKDNRLFSKYFKELYDDNKKDEMFKNQLDQSDNKNTDRNDLVDIYWEKYRKDKIAYARKNKMKFKKTDISKNNISLNNVDLMEYSAIHFGKEIYLIQDDVGIVLKKDKGGYVKIYSDITDINVPEEFKKQAEKEGILNMGNDGVYLLNNFTLLKAYMDTVNDRILEQYSNYKYIVYQGDDDEYILLNENYLSLEEYIEYYNLKMSDIVEQDTSEN